MEVYVANHYSTTGLLRFINFNLDWHKSIAVGQPMRIELALIENNLRYKLDNYGTMVGMIVQIY